MLAIQFQTVKYVQKKVINVSNYYIFKGFSFFFQSVTLTDVII